IVVRATPVNWLIRLITAPGTTAYCASRTVPTRDAFWASAGSASSPTPIHNFFIKPTKAFCSEFRSIVLPDEGRLLFRSPHVFEEDAAVSSLFPVVFLKKCPRSLTVRRTQVVTAAAGIGAEVLSQLDFGALPLPGPAEDRSAVASLIFERSSRHSWMRQYAL